MKKIELIHSPALLPWYNLQGKTVVVIDILRATSTMCVAFHTGVNKILPIASPDECKMFKDFDFIIAAERNAVKVPGFDMGNSPFEYENPFLAGKNIAFTTTNGTKAIKMAKAMEPYKILIGSFLNITALANHIITLDKDLVLLCAGWKDKYNLEDTLFGGALIDKLLAHFEIEDDAALSAHCLFLQYQNNIEEIVRKSSHAKRFTLLHVQTDDVSFCLQQDLYSFVPEMDGEYIVNYFGLTH
ncbi:MAG: 2-phosphosulfolactate phosphatase [Sphingobacteriales bacterium]|jgi:2-phosphosulfolactate phosphatase|nr:2-phosphosulfolactate phosphatase [Sphingobacteriales bacterium]